MTPPNATREGTAPPSPERWARVRALVEQVLALPPQSRSALLDVACGADQDLRTEVERLATACDRATASWGFLAHPAGELVAPLIAADAHATGTDGRAEGAPAALCAALADRYVVGAELGRGGMATVYVADDRRHHRTVAIKVLDPHLGAMLGAERFLSEIRVTANLRHPNLVPLFDSGEASGLLYYVMPLIDGATLRARIQRERQLPVDEAVRIVRVIAGALDYAHRQGVVHRDLKPENILLQDGEPLVADFGISLAVTNAAGSRQTASGMSFGTPQYMSPEQAALGSPVDGRSDIYSLACVLYELLAGNAPFTGNRVDVVIAKVLGEPPPSVRTSRPSVPANVEAALARALAKVPADRYATAREFADALGPASMAAPTSAPAITRPWRRRTRLALRAAGTVALVGVVWVAARPPATPVSRFVERNLMDQSLGSGVTMTPNGRALVYTRSGEAGRVLMLRPLDQRPERTLAGTAGAGFPFVAPDGRRVAFALDGAIRIASFDDSATGKGSIWNWTRKLRFGKWPGAPAGWRYGNGAWDGDSVIVPTMGAPALSKRRWDGGVVTVLSRPDTANGDFLHAAPLLLPGSRTVVFTVRRRGGPGIVTGRLAIASLDPAAERLMPAVSLGVTARRAIAFVDGWLLFITADGNAIQAVRLDVERRRVSGTPISVVEDEAGDLESGSLADNGTLMYVRRPRTNAAMFVDSSGAVRPLLASARGSSFMYPRISPDSKRLAMQVTTESDGRQDVWVYDIAARTSKPLTTTGRALHPTWTPDGRRIVFMMAERRGFMSQAVDGGEAAGKVLDSEFVFAPTVSPDGRSVVFQQGIANGPGWSLWSTPLYGRAAPHKVLADPGSPYMPAVSPDGRWLAYVASASGRKEVYARAFPGPGQAVQISDGGGIEPAWSADGRRIYYRIRDAFMAAAVTTPALAVTSRRQLFKDTYDGAMAHRNYDVSPDGSGFLMLAQESPEAVVVLNWLTELRARLARAR